MRDPNGPSRTSRVTDPDYLHPSKTRSTINMLDIEDFDAVYRNLHYNDGLVQEIQSYRTALGGRTFFERLLTLLNIKGKSRILSGFAKC